MQHKSACGKLETLCDHGKSVVRSFAHETLVFRFPSEVSRFTGDFNAHHAMWYGELAPNHPNSILHNIRDATALIDWAQVQGLALLNPAGVFTHHPFSNRTPSIIELNFASGNLLNSICGWASDVGLGRASNHAALFTVRTFLHPHRLHHKTDWPTSTACMNQLRLTD